MKETFTSPIILYLNMEFPACFSLSLVLCKSLKKKKSDRLVVAPVKSISKLTAFNPA